VERGRIVYDQSQIKLPSGHGEFLKPARRRVPEASAQREMLAV
jgi:hypothetical protein